MANTIGSLVIDLVANTAQFSTELQKAVKEVEGGVDKIKKAFEVLGVGLSVAGMTELYLETIKFGDELAKAAIKTGTSANAISELAFAARQANVDLPQLTASLDKMEKSISLAASGTAKSSSTFEALGISLDQIRKLAPDQQFAEIANQINKLKDPTDRARAAIEIFGRAGADMLPLFAEGAEGIAKAREQAIQFGQSFDAEQLKKLSDAADSVRNLKESFNALTVAVVATVAGPLSRFFDSITNLVTDNKAGLLTAQIKELQARLDYAQAGDTASPLIRQLQGEILKAEVALQAVKTTKQIQDALTAGAAGLTDASAPGYVTDQIDPIQISRFKIQTDALKKFYDDLDAATQTGAEKLYNDTAKAQAQLDLLVADGVISLSDSFNRMRAPEDEKAISSFFATNAAAIQDSIKSAEETSKQANAAMAEDARISQQATRHQFEQTSRFAVDTGQAITNTFASAFENIGQGGLRGLVQSFVKAFAAIIAQAEATDIAKALGITDAFAGQGGNSALGAIFNAIFGGGTDSFAPATFDSQAALGYAGGGSFDVGGTGGTDSQLVQFRATPGENVTIGGGGKTSNVVNFSPVYHVGSGVSRTDVISACRTTQQVTIAHITRLITGGAFAV
jgi:hypothetical protein